MGNPKTRHCWNGTPSVVAALATLGGSDDADFGQVWHLPTYGLMTGYESCSSLGEVCNCTVTPRLVTAGMLRVMGLFNPTARATTLDAETRSWVSSPRASLPSPRPDQFPGHRPVRVQSSPAQRCQSSCSSGSWP